MSDHTTLIEAMLSDHAAAMRRADAPAVIADYAPGIVQFTLAPPLVQDGRTALDPAGLQAWFDGHGGGPMDYEITALAVETDGAIAFAHSLNRMGAPGGGFILWFRATYGLRLVDGAWLIAHEHTSTPFYMDGSLRAALDLTP